MKKNVFSDEDNYLLEMLLTKYETLQLKLNYS